MNVLKTSNQSSTVVSPNKGTQIRESFPYLHQNFTNKGMSKFPLFGQKSCENRPFLGQNKWIRGPFGIKLETFEPKIKN